MYYSTKYNSQIGTITLACKDNNLVGLWMEGQKYHSAGLSEELIPKDDIAVFSDVKSWLDQYFEGMQPDIKELSLAPIGGVFRQDVWSILCEIPYGEVLTYGDIAKRMAVRRGKERMSAQAVGGAIGHNPISIIIPCHRVVGSNGNLTGYAGGIAMKQCLLKHEGVDISQFSVPKG